MGFWLVTVGLILFFVGWLLRALLLDKRFYEENKLPPPPKNNDDYEGQ